MLYFNRFNRFLAPLSLCSTRAAGGISEVSPPMSLFQPFRNPFLALLSLCSTCVGGRGFRGFAQHSVFTLTRLASARFSRPNFARASAPSRPPHSPHSLVPRAIGPVHPAHSPHSLQRHARVDLPAHPTRPTRSGPTGEWTRLPTPLAPLARRAAARCPRPPSRRPQDLGRSCRRRRAACRETRRATLLLLLPAALSPMSYAPCEQKKPPTPSPTNP